MKKILILSMTCEDSFFNEQSKVIKETWAKPVIEGKYPHIDYLEYKGNTQKHIYDKTNNLLNVKCEDDIDNTFKKTYYALDIIQKNFNYDYIFRTNTSTYVNVDLLDAFIQSLDDDSVLWTSELYSLSEAFVPYPLYLYGRGNGILMSKKIVNIILKEGINFLYFEKCDDWIIGNILNSYWIKQGENYLDHIKSYMHGWFKCIYTKAENNNSICPYYNEITDYEFLNKFVTIQIKRYRERDKENQHYRELDNIFKAHSDDNIDWNSIVEENKKYSENPNIFIGSIIGYISYDKWLAYDKQELYKFEINNKASDDAERYKKKRMLL